MSTKNVIVLSILTMVAYVMRLEIMSDRTAGSNDDLNLDGFETLPIKKALAKNHLKMTSMKDPAQTAISKKHDVTTRASFKASLVNIKSRSKLNRQLKREKSPIKREPSWEDLMTYAKKNSMYINKRAPSIKKCSSNPSLHPQKESLMKLISSPQSSFHGQLSPNLELVIEDINEGLTSDTSEL